MSFDSSSFELLQQKDAAVKWNTIRGLSDATDMIYVYVSGTGSKALIMPIKNSTTAQGNASLSIMFFCFRFCCHLFFGSCFFKLDFGLGFTKSYSPKMLSTSVVPNYSCLS